MNLKPCEIPERAIFDLAVKRRTVSTHPKRGEVEASYQNRMKGYRGEKSLDYYLEMLPMDKYDIIHDLRLQRPNSDKFFQIDTLLLSTMVIMPLESKNQIGNLHFEKDLSQALLTFPDSNRQKRVQNPILQVRNQAIQLKNWLDEHNMGNIPIEYLFVNSNKESIVTTDKGNEHIFKRVSTSEGLIDKIHTISLNQPQANIKKSYLEKVENLLLSAHTPQELDLQRIYGIGSNEIVPGVHCPKCVAIPMMYQYGKWICLLCNYQSKTAFLPTLNDYFMLVKPTITNQEFCYFFNISNPRIAYRILHSLNLPSNGTKKGRIYYKPEKNFPFDE